MSEMIKYVMWLEEFHSDKLKNKNLLPCIEKYLDYRQKQYPDIYCPECKLKFKEYIGSHPVCDTKNCKFTDEYFADQASMYSEKY